jgi:hypothetical protein
MIRAIIIEYHLSAAQQLATLLEDTWQVEVIGIGTGSAAVVGPSPGSRGAATGAAHVDTYRTGGVCDLLSFG